MLEITEGFTSITAGADCIAPPPGPDPGDSRQPGRRVPTGARITLEFSRAAALPPNQPVRVRYEFGDGGIVREVVGIAKATYVDMCWGRAVVYHYRLSYWIAAAELIVPAANTMRHPTEEAPSLLRSIASA